MSWHNKIQNKFRNSSVRIVCYYRSHIQSKTAVFQRGKILNVKQKHKKTYNVFKNLFYNDNECHVS